MGLLKTEYEKGVIVTIDGRVDQAVKWKRPEQKSERQDIILRNKEGQETGRIKRRLIKTLDGFVDEFSRWDFKKKEWKNPPLKYSVVDLRTFSFVRAVKVWPDQIPELEYPFALATIAPPKTLGVVYNEDTDAWEAPRKVCIVDAEGEVVQICLEHPSEKTPNVEPPEGMTRFDDRDWPTDDAGTKIGLGHKLKKKKWFKMTREEKAASKPKRFNLPLAMETEEKMQKRLKKTSK